ncbi:MAG: hypothetical protein ACHQF0_09500 [Chitinophagales bacterium]
MRLSIFILLLAITTACQRSSKIPEDFDYGKIENGVYTNNYFAFEIPVPAAWAVQSREQVQQLQKQGEDIASGNNTELRTKLKAADIQTAILLTVFKNKPDSAISGFNSSFIILAENLGMSGVKEGKDYLEHAKEIMKQSNVSYLFSPEYYSEKIGNKKFDAMDATLSSNADSVRQIYYSTIDRNFALSFIISYSNSQQKTELKNIINKIRFR